MYRKADLEKDLYRAIDTARTNALGWRATFESLVHIFEDDSKIRSNMLDKERDAQQKKNLTAFNKRLRNLHKFICDNDL